MDYNENYFLSLNKHLEEKLDYCIHNIETRLDKLFLTKLNLCDSIHNVDRNHPTTKNYSQYSGATFSHFKAPYIRDFRNFSGPSNDDIKQIHDLKGTEDIDLLIKNKSWTKESKKQLFDAVLDHYSQNHVINLIKQKNNLLTKLKETPGLNRSDTEQKIFLIEEQANQVKARKDQRIFVPENRVDLSIDWCAISAKLANTQHDPQDCRLLWSNELHWSINQEPWTKEEDICLLNAVQKFGKNDWDLIAKELNSNRLPWQCCSRYHQEFVNASCGPTPTNEDDVKKIVDVIDACRIGNFVPWNQVMYFIQYHSLHQVKYQWHKWLSKERSGSSWSHLEDVLLLKSVERFGDKDWTRVSNYIPGRSNKSCRERYTMRLKFSRRAIGHWRSKEDEILLSLIERFGTNWKLVSYNFPERNCHQLRSRYELLKNETGRVGPMKQRKLIRIEDGTLMTITGRRHKPTSESEVDSKLLEIFETYANVKSNTKSLVCRSAQDELIHQKLVNIIRSRLIGKETEYSLLGNIIERAIKERVSSKYNLFAPCLATLRGYKAWILQQDHLQHATSESINLESISSSTEYLQLLKIVMSLFLWPTILSRIQVPNLKLNNFQSGSIIEKDAKNLYKVREIQKQVTSMP